MEIGFDEIRQYEAQNHRDRRIAVALRTKGEHSEHNHNPNVENIILCHIGAQKTENGYHRHEDLGWDMDNAHELFYQQNPNHEVHQLAEQQTGENRIRKNACGHKTRTRLDAVHD